MLNQNDRRRLEAIERQLQSEDPDFARRFTQWPPTMASRRPSRRVLVLMISGFGLLLSLALLSPALFFVSAAGGVAGWVWLRRDHGDAGRAEPEDGAPRW
jgi:hypothetical protein